MEETQDLIFMLALILILIHYATVIMSNKYKIKEKHITYSQELVKYVVAAWIGSIIGGSA